MRRFIMSSIYNRRAIESIKGYINKEHSGIGLVNWYSFKYNKKNDYIRSACSFHAYKMYESVINQNNELFKKYIDEYRVKELVFDPEQYNEIFRTIIKTGNLYYFKTMSKHVKVKIDPLLFDETLIDSAKSNNPKMTLTLIEFIFEKEGFECVFDATLKDPDIIRSLFYSLNMPMMYHIKNNNFKSFEYLLNVFIKMSKKYKDTYTNEYLQKMIIESCGCDNFDILKLLIEKTFVRVDYNLAIEKAKQSKNPFVMMNWIYPCHMPKSEMTSITTRETKNWIKTRNKLRKTGSDYVILFDYEKYEYNSKDHFIKSSCEFFANGFYESVIEQNKEDFDFYMLKTWDALKLSQEQLNEIFGAVVKVGNPKVFDRYTKCVGFELDPFTYKQLLEDSAHNNNPEMTLKLIDFCFSKNDVDDVFESKSENLLYSLNFVLMYHIKNNNYKSFEHILNVFIKTLDMNNKKNMYLQNMIIESCGCDNSDILELLLNKTKIKADYKKVIEKAKQSKNPETMINWIERNKN